MRGVILFMLSSFLAIVLLPIGVVFGLIVAFYHFHIGTGLKNADKKLIVLATAIDKYGNVVCAELFNAILITKESTYLFGKIEQTISMVIGYNLINGTLSKAGKKLNNILSLFDKDHSLKAIKQNN